MADITVDGLEGGYVPVLYTSKTKVVIDFECFFIIISSGANMEYVLIESVEIIKCVHTVEPGGRWWAPAGMKVQRQGGQFASHTPANKLQTSSSSQTPAENREE